MAQIYFTIICWSISMLAGATCQGTLEKVFIISRHGLRTPLTPTLERMTPKKWPEWSEDFGHLTKTGAVLERYMGNYFAEWLKDVDMFDTCPKDEEVHIFANTRERTKDTAKAFTEAAFPNCNIKVHAKNSSEMDPVFLPAIRNNSKDYIDAGKAEMKNKLNETDFKDVYEVLNAITDIKRSDICKKESYCDLAKDYNTIIFEVGLEPNITGPLFLGCAIVDAFLMSYYEGFPMKDIAWGEIKNKETWELLTTLLKQNLNVRFNTSAAKDIAMPFLKYMKDKLLYGEEKFTLLVGHDSNIMSVLCALGVNDYNLPGQFEKTPIGGKVLFQKWRIDDEYYLKTEYVYQTAEQLRKGEDLSIAKPPKHVTLASKHCNIDSNGHCKWKDFVNLLNNIIV